MKKLLLFVLAISMISVSSSFGQSYKKFKVGVGLLYAVPTGDGAGGGIGFYVEPKLNLNDKFDAGLLIESALMVTAIDGMASSVSGVTSYSLTGGYMMGTGKFRPFIGTGIGMYKLGSLEVTVGDDDAVVGNADLGTNFGFSPRIGFNASHFQLQLQYHIITGQEDFINKNFLAIKAGFEFGGGKK